MSFWRACFYNEWDTYWAKPVGWFITNKGTQKVHAPEETTNIQTLYRMCNAKINQNIHKCICRFSWMWILFIVKNFLFWKSLFISIEFGLKTWNWNKCNAVIDYRSIDSGQQYLFMNNMFGKNIYYFFFFFFFLGLYHYFPTGTFWFEIGRELGSVDPQFSCRPTDCCFVRQSCDH